MVNNSIYMLNQKSLYSNQISVYMLNQKPLCMINQVEWDEKSLKPKFTIQQKFNTKPNKNKIHVLPLQNECGFKTNVAGKATLNTNVMIPVVLPAIIDVVSGDGDGISDGYDDSGDGDDDLGDGDRRTRIRARSCENSVSSCDRCQSM